MKKKTINKFWKTILPISVTIFLFMLALYAWDYVSAHKFWFLIGSGAIILISIVFGYFIPKKFFRGVKKKFKEVF